MRVPYSLWSEEQKTLDRARRRARYAENSGKILEQQKKWLERNPDKKEMVRLRAKKWYWNNVERARKTKLAYNDIHREQARVRAAKWHKENRDRHLASTKRYRELNKERMAEITKQWKRENKDRVLTSIRNRKALLKGARGKHTAQEVMYLLEQQRWLCAHCGESVREKRHVDHVIPLCAGGSNEAHNLQILCPSCNLAKGRKIPAKKEEQCYGR